jgi:hypothetical protein
MGYDILTDDLFKEDESSSKKEKPKKKLEFSNIYIHIIILLLILIPVIIYFYSDYSFLNEEKQSNFLNLDLVGDLDEFNISYNGNLKVESKVSLLTTKFSKILQENKEFEILNFSGNIFLYNDSIYFNGNGDKIIFDDNLINLNGENFELKAQKKVSFKLNLSELKINFQEGRLILGEILTFNMQNSSVDINNFNASISYDGKFSLNGIFDSFILNSFGDNLSIKFKNFDLNSLKD